MLRRSGVILITLIMLRSITSSVYTLTNLTGGDRYYFAVTSYNKAGNESNYSNEVTKTIEPRDTIPPAQITDLAATTGTDSGGVDLFWTALGDDGNIGTSAEYIIKYSQSHLREDKWQKAEEIPNSLTPQAAGSPQNFTVRDLTPGKTYYFAIKTEDKGGNASGISNSPSAAARELNNPPILGPITDITVNEGETITITPVATDPNGDTLTYSVQGLPDGVVYNFDPNTGRLEWITDTDDAGEMI